MKVLNERTARSILQNFPFRCRISKRAISCSCSVRNLGTLIQDKCPVCQSLLLLSNNFEIAKLETSTENLNSKANSKNLNFLLNKANNKVNQRALDINNDPFLKELSNQTYENTANTQHKFHLIDMIIGKVVQILGIKNEIILDILKTNKLDEASRIKIFNGILKFQKSNNIDDLKFLYTDLKVFELTETNFNPSKVFDLRLFLNTHVRN